MTLLIARLTLRQLLGQKRLYVLLLVAALPVLMAIVFQFAAEDDDVPQDFAAGLAEGFHINLLLPLIALVLGTAALGQEMEDGTAVYLLARPVARWRILAGKLGAAWLAGVALFAVAVMVSLAVALAGEPNERLVLAFLVAGVLGMGAYCALFVTLSVFTGRALIAGLIYVFIWEAVVTNLLPGVRYFSVREYTLAIADAITTVRSEYFEADLALAPAIAFMAILTTAIIGLGIHRLGSFELGERI